MPSEKPGVPGWNGPGMLYRCIQCLALVASLSGAVFAEDTPRGLWVQVDTAALTLSVMRGEQVLVSFENIAIGSNGATWDKQAGDEKTPLGTFSVNEIRLSERFHVFLGLDYPNLDHLERARRSGRLGDRDYRRVKNALARGGPPPQDTALGGHIGIHGLGKGSPEIHALVNWTNGCIALTNSQVEELAATVRTGTQVRIQ